jgi:capsular polysaccharide biosynthesis protein
LPPVCESVLQWALSHPDADVQRLHEAATIRRHSPRALDHLAAQQFFSSFPPEYVLPEQYLARLPGAFLVGDVGLVVLPDGSFSAESIYDRSHLLDASAYRTPLPAHPRFERGDFYSLLIKFAQGQNYYHWLHDVVLRLHDIVDRLPLTTRFVVPSHRLPFQDEFLSIAGVNAQRLWEFDGGIVQFENLYFSPPSALPGTDSPAAEIWFRDRALSIYGISLGPACRRVYITRRNARYHRIVNEREVETLLQEFGFETHELEKYSVRDQIALFAEAEAVVAAHGAGLTNILFSPPGLRVIDIFEGSFFNKCFWGISTAVGHHYWPLVGDTVTNNGHSLPDIRVSIPSLRQVVSEW